MLPPKFQRLPRTIPGLASRTWDTSSEDEDEGEEDESDDGDLSRRHRLDVRMEYECNDEDIAPILDNKPSPRERLKIQAREEILTIDLISD
jgi:hypothetical protein